MSSFEHILDHERRARRAGNVEAICFLVGVLLIVAALAVGL